MDKVNIASARVVGLQQSLHLSDYQYTVALTVTYIPYILSGFPSALVLKYVGPDILLPAMVTLWGVAAACQGLVNGYSGLLACRFFLGLFEGGVVPSITLYLSFFYPRMVLQKRITSLYVVTVFSAPFMIMLGAAISQMNGTGGKPGWAWMFIIEGLFTICFGVISFFLLPPSPGKARFLTERERSYVVSVLKQAGSVSEDDVNDNFSWTEVIRAAKSPHVWLLVITAFLGGTILSGLVFFQPSIIVSLGYTGFQAQLMSAPPLLVTVVFSITAAVIADHYRCRGYTFILFAFLEMIGATIFYANKSRHVRYGSLFFWSAGVFGSMPAAMTWLANNVAPHARRASALAAFSITTELGGILATWLLGYISPAPDYKAAMITFTAMSVISVILAVVNLVYLTRQNSLKAVRRRYMKKEDEPDSLGDRSAWFIYSL
ncbi:major facilitator superfamily domain-containing protein [Chiua virens]|nr:major facilitator superfamily domain-containing protein [Chiua virens]